MRLIDADALIKETMERYCKDCERRKGVKNGKWKIVYSIGDAPCRACGTGDMIDELEDAPTIEERKTGRWILVTNGRGGYECDQCHSYAPAWQTGEERLTDYCPHCGSPMEVEHD